MKNILQISMILLLALTGCKQESRAAENEYEFLTPYVVVLKNSTRPRMIPNLATVGNNIIHHSLWHKENGLKRDRNGNILKTADVDCFTFLVLGEPLKPGEKRNFNICTVQYDPEKPSNIFKLNQLGNGAYQKKKYAYMGAWLGSRGALPLKHLAGKEFEIRNADDGKTVFTGILKLL